MYIKDKASYFLNYTLCYIFSLCRQQVLFHFFSDARTLSVSNSHKKGRQRRKLSMTTTVMLMDWLFTSLDIVVVLVGGVPD